MEHCSSCLNTSTAVNKTRDDVYGEFPSGTKIALLSVYALFLMFAIVGNSLVCWIVIINRSMHNVTNYLLVNLAVSDLLLALSSIFQVSVSVVRDLNIGDDIGCKLKVNMTKFAHGSSVLTVTFIAYERYCAVCRPMYFQYVKDRIKWIIPSIWLTSVCIVSPSLYFCELRVNEDNKLRCDCSLRWSSEQAQMIYSTMTVMVLYAVPLVVIIAFYSVVIRRLRRAIPGEEQSTSATYQSRQGVIKMLLVSLVVFFIFWAPLNVLTLLMNLKVIHYKNIYESLWFPSLLLAFAHCICNPVIYCLLGNKFREGFKSALCCINCRFPHFVQTCLGHSSTFQ